MPTSTIFQAINAAAIKKAKETISPGWSPSPYEVKRQTFLKILNPSSEDLKSYEQIAAAPNASKMDIMMAVLAKRIRKEGKFSPAPLGSQGTTGNPSLLGSA